MNVTCKDFTIKMDYVTGKDSVILEIIDPKGNLVYHDDAEGDVAEILFNAKEIVKGLDNSV